MLAAQFLADEQMLALLTEAGFTADAPVALPGTPLTVKIWTGTRAGATAPQPIGKTINA